MSKQSDLVNVAQDAGTDGYVKVTDASTSGTDYLITSGSRYKFFGSEANNVEIGSYSSSNTSRNVYMSIDSAGRVTKPYQPCFSAYVSRVYSASSTASKVLYDGTFINVGSHFNTSTNTFTAPVNGKYKFNARVSIQVSSGEYARAANVMFYLNGSIYQGNFHNIRNAIPPVSGSAVYHGLEGSAIINLSANDTISVYLNWESDGTLDASENVHYHGTYFEGHLLG